mmetsp:Transcript_26551/g.76457  ORF Transcript_26551/g.76457 Transcript_26551/m.76457 type:complete len:490 (-) Transcript_26551:362-1831(-)
MPGAPRDKVYWIAAATKTIQRANLDGSNVENIVSGLSVPFGIAVDPDGEKVYWIDLGIKKIQRANHDGSNKEDVLVDIDGPAAVALGPLKLYWIDRKLKQIMSANLNGSRVTTVISDLKNPNALALDSSAGKIYWGDFGTKKIHRANLDGSCAEALVAYGKNSNGIAVDPQHGKIYWANFGTRAIFRSNLDGSAMEGIVAGLENPNAVALAPDAGRVYWVDRDARRIQRARLDGSGVEDVVRGVEDPWGVALGPGERRPDEAPGPELRLRVVRPGSGAAPLELLFDPRSSGRDLQRRVQDAVGRPPRGREQRLFLANPGQERVRVQQLEMTLEELGVMDAATVEAELVESAPEPVAAPPAPAAETRLPDAGAQLEGPAPDDAGMREIKKYSWGDEGDSVKLYITEAANAEAIAAAKDGKGQQVEADFKQNSFSLTVHGEKQRFVLVLRGLFRETVPERCKFRVSAGKRITVTLAKKEQVPWTALSEKTW